MANLNEKSRNKDAILKKFETNKNIINDSNAKLFENQGYLVLFILLNNKF